MSELKSAWEIAQERANRLGKLSAEEKEQQERQGYYQIGQALARKYLDNPQMPDMTAELNKYEEKERDLVKQAVIEHLAEAIELTSARGIDGVKRAIEAISSLRPELQPKAEEIGQLLWEYEEAEQKIRQGLESTPRETLHQLRISGTAVDAINVEANPQWQSAHQGLIEAFTPRLNDLKQALISQH
jgi:valyl-tRNA synthetase